MLRRINKDIRNLYQNGYDVETEIDELSKIIFINVKGPKGTIYEKGKWKIRIEFPQQYPFKSPCVSFYTKIYHPNVEYNSGAICLDALNTNWTPSYDITNIIEVFIPQLLSYPNPDDPFNIEASDLLKKDKDLFAKKVIQIIELYC
jgi:ubiquitin-conjugating enzyme E2 H